MQLDLKFSVYTLGLAAGTFTAALYGMNLKNFIEESDLGFWGVSAFCAVSCVVVFGYGLHKLRKVQRLKMWGGGQKADRLGRLGGVEGTGLGAPANRKGREEWWTWEKDMRDRRREQELERIREGDPRPTLSEEVVIHGEGQGEAEEKNFRAAEKLARMPVAAARIREP